MLLNTPLVQMAVDQLRTPLQRRIGIRKLYQWPNRNQLQLLVRSDGTANATITRLPNGRIHYDPPPKMEWTENYSDCAVWQLPHTTVRDFISQNAKPAERAVKKMLRQKHPQTVKFNQRTIKDLYPHESIEWAAEEALAAALMATVQPPTQHHDITALARLIEDQWDLLVNIKSSLRAPDELTIDPYKHDITTLSQYNLLVTHGQALHTLMEETPVVTMLWWHNLAHLEDPPIPRRKTAAALTKALRDHLNMTPAQWRILLASGHLAITQPWDCGALDAIRKATQTIAQARVRDHCPVVAANLLSDQGYATTMTQHIMELDDLKTARSWVSAIRQALLDHQKTCEYKPLPRCRSYQDMYDLSPTECTNVGELLTSIGHAILWHHDNNRPWRNSNWRGLLAQTAQWIDDIHLSEEHANDAHLVEVIENAQYYDIYLQELQWNSLIGPVQLKGYSVRPITSYRSILQTGSQIGRSHLPYYAERCVEGTHRLFSLHRPNRNSPEATEAATEITLTAQGTWAPGKTTAAGRKGPTQVHRQVAQQLARMYQEAQQEEEARATNNPDQH